MTPRVLLLASTFPRFRGDHCGRFLGEYVEALDLPVTVCAPHTAGAACSESWAPTAHVRRFRPGRAPIAYGAGIPDNLRARPWLAAGLPGFLGRWTRAAIRLAKDADVIDAHWALPGGLVGAIASRATGVPLRLVLHSGGVHALSRLPYAARWARLLAAQATQITAVSRPLADRFVRLAALSQSLESCPMGITPSELMTTPAPGTVGFRGRLVPVKGADLLVDACTSLGASLLVAGEGPEKTSLEERALGLGCRATFLGSTAETPSAEVVAFPSRLLPSGRSEGLPVSLLEAMSAGAAVVVADVGGVRDVLRHGQNGLLVPPNDSGALAAAIGSLLGSASARARLGAQARSDSAALHWAHIGPKHRELLWTAANA